MSDAIARLEPRSLWKHFAALNAIPRPSKKEGKVIDFMMDFAASLGLEASRDAVGNVLVRKPASPGMEDRKTLVLQAHLDMVHQKNNDTDFDFEAGGIRMYTDGDWVRAKGTTLGADNGLGVAAIMGVLASNAIPHPPLEALFTIDEETGMTGAKGLSPDLLKGEILLNLDTEQDDTLEIGCAGGIDVTGTGKYTPVPTGEGHTGFRLRVKGLLGGHSGMDIHKGLANANVLIARILMAAWEQGRFSLSELHGGNLRNAIPRESEAVLAVPKAGKADFREAVEGEMAAILEEFGPREPGLQLLLEDIPAPGPGMGPEAVKTLLSCLCGLHHGVYAMNQEFPGLVETSNNVAQVSVQNGEIRIGCLTRSARESSKANLVRKLRAVFSLAEYRTETSGEYPGWLPDPSSEILSLLSRRYEALFGQPPVVGASHGGLECGILKHHYPEMDMVSFGPTILGAHSPDERASVSSSQKFWKLLLDVLEHTP
ncbi:aminoacyl-histidine dipeptidase [Robiginitalea marina]|uniref:Aminoacyl-histidine dipeptidase n=1 Tax=Robiginitalea marina TaxID=2954105 RepID=A0ABT1AZI6_9FLAO|nr:aminoacyl-histidine dipeptidase [Robiginitalea marina]MCO5725461.1 aminoacyl-histidine dipeptidase [Robiginitalea marina]